MIILEVIKAVGFTFFGIMEAFVVSLLELAPVTIKLNNIFNAFTYPAIICGLIGIPVSLSFIVKYLMKQFSKKVR